MDEEKFSLERFLALMDERDEKAPPRPEPRPGRRRGGFFHALRAGIAPGSAQARRERFSAEGTELAESAGASASARRLFRGRARDDAARDEAASVVRHKVGEALTREEVGGGADRREVLRAHALRGGSGGDANENTEPSGRAEPVGVFGRLIAKLRGVRSDDTAVGRARDAHRVADDDGRGKSANDGVFAGSRGVGVGYDEGAWSGEMRARGVRKYRAAAPVWRGETRSVAEVGESAPSGERPRSEKRVFTGNYADSTETHGKIAEFRKSDASGDVDIRAISRAIERDARRY